MKRSLKFSASGRSLLFMGLVLLSSSLEGCGPGEAPATTTPAPAATTTAVTNPGHPAKSPPVSWRRQRLKERAEKSGVQ